MTSTSRRMGEFLVSRKVLSREALEDVLVREEATGVPLAKILSSERLVGERDLVAAIADQLGVRFWDPTEHPVQLVVSGLLPATLVRKHGAVAVGVDGGQLVVAMIDPTAQEAIDQIAWVSGWPVLPALASRADVAAATMAIYGEGEGIEDRDRSDDSDIPEPLHLNSLLVEMLSVGASDLHLSAGLPPCIRVDGAIQPMDGYEPLTASELRELVYGILTQRQREKFETALELDTSHSVPGAGRFRLNVFLQKDAVGAVLRAIPFAIVPLERLGIPAVVADLSRLPRGLVLVTGPTGSGKSTTLASIVDLINTHRALHIMTVEDPIEFLHTSKRAVVNQREVGEDTHSFADALKHVLRQDPDVILVGEMRDLETISAALTAAETGHLVFGTLHTQDAPQSIDRIIDVFPSHQQQQIRVQLASALQAVVTQQLLAKSRGKGRAAAVEVLVATPAVRNLIREGKVHQIYSVMQAGGKYGMQTMDQSLGQLVRRSEVSMEVALEHCHHDEDLRRLATGAR